MFSVANLIERAKANANIESDYRLSKIIGINQSAFGNYKAGRSWPSDKILTERSVWRWLSDESAPYAALAALWHETPNGRYATAIDVGNELAIVRGLAAAHGAQAERETARLSRLIQIADCGSANDPLLDFDCARLAPRQPFLRLRN